MYEHKQELKFTFYELIMHCNSVSHYCDLLAGDQSINSKKAPSKEILVDVGTVVFTTLDYHQILITD